MRVAEPSAPVRSGPEWEPLEEANSAGGQEAGHGGAMRTASRPLPASPFAPASRCRPCALPAVVCGGKAGEKPSPLGGASTPKGAQTVGVVSRVNVQDHMMCPLFGRRWRGGNSYPGGGTEKQQPSGHQLRGRRAALWSGRFPRTPPPDATPYKAVPDTFPRGNRLQKDHPRVLLILPWLTTGGADKFNLDLVEQLTNRGCGITICTTREGDNSWLPKFAEFTPDIFTLGDSLGLSDYPRFLRDRIESRQVDVVLISNSELGYHLLPYLRSRCPDVTFVDYNHIVEEYWKNGGHPRSAVGYQELLDLNIVSSENLKKWMVGKGADASRIEVCYTNVDPHRWDPAKHSRSEIRRALGVPERLPLLLYAGRLCPQKRPRLFAKAMLELARQKVDFGCLVAGDGEERRFLEFFVWRHRLGKRVRLLGEVSNERMRELMAAADIFFLPSQMEGIALTLFEAMAMEVVPVSADVGGQSELVKPDCGFLILQGENELQEYVSVLGQLIESAELRASKGAAGRERILEHFTIDQMAGRMIELFSKAQELARTSPRPSVGRGLGLESATLAMEYTRLDRLAEELQSLSPIRRSRFWRLGQRAADTLPGWLAYELVRSVASKLQVREE